MLLDADANVHAKDDYALRWASANGCAEVVKLLKQYSKKKKKVSENLSESIKHLKPRS
jgi:ankyrin repeat protein